jgi:Anti-sigma factor NepR
VTRPAKPTNPSVKAGGVQIFGAPVIRRKARDTAPGEEAQGGPCLKKAASKPDDITDQIAQHLRNIYDDVLKQPVPGRFVELLRQLESSSASRPAKDGK